MRSRSSITMLMVMLVSWTGAATMSLPNQPDSLKFAVLGDSGTGDRAQYELAGQMAALHDRFKYGVVLLLGGNIHGAHRPQDFMKRFEVPFQRLLQGGVTFHAALGKEDSREQRYYKNFNMNGSFYYTFNPRPGVQFFALDSSDVTSEQVGWLEARLKESKSDWKIVYLHQPIYSSGRRHGPDPALRQSLEPLFRKYNVSVVFSGRDNFYERTQPQGDTVYFVVGSGGKLRRNDIDRSSGLTAAGFDTDLAFLAAEVIGDRMYFDAISRTGQTVDSGVVARRR
jgi:hypothetical protein